MASGSKRGRSRGLGAGHLLGIFFLLAMIMAVVFALGYMLGRSQYDAKFRTAVTDIAGEPAGAAARAQPAPGVKSAEKPGPAAARRPAPDSRDIDAGDPPAATPDWDYYRSAEPRGKETLRSQPQPAPAAGARAASPPVPAKSKRQAGASKSVPPPLNPPIIPRGSFVLQVAALAHESDALAMAQMLRQKKFPAFVLSPDADKFYRVQVGPYANAKTANAVRQRLEAAGFKTIIKK